MPRTKAVLAAATAALVAGVCGSLAAAQADTTGTTGATGTTAAASAATIAVNGSGFATADQNAATGTFQSDYLTALGSALTDAKAKATMLATQSGDVLGAVTNVTEESNDNGGCASPMFAAAGSAKRAPSVVPKTHKRHRKVKTSLAAAVVRIADVPSTTCTIEADVTVTFSMAPA